MTSTIDTAAIDAARLERAVESAGRLAAVGRYASFPLRRAWLDVRQVGRHKVPDTGAVILAANHLAFIDSLLLMYSLERPVSFLGKSEYLEHPVARHVFPATGMLPLDRSGRHARITLDRAAEILVTGGAIGVHPEGTRSRDGLLGPGHPGVAQLALRTGAPIVPVGLVNTDKVQPVGQSLPQFRGRIEIRFGEPITIEPWAERRRSATSRRELTETVMSRISQLSGQDRRETVLHGDG